MEVVHRTSTPPSTVQAAHALGFGQPDSRSDTDRLHDLRRIGRQVMSICRTLNDPALAERSISNVRDRRADRSDHAQYVPIPNKHGASTLAAVNQLLIRAEAEEEVRRLLTEGYGLESVAVPELDNRVVRLCGRNGRTIELSHLAASLRRQGVPISANYMTPTPFYLGGITSPKWTAGPVPDWPSGADAREEATRSPVRVVIIDTGVYGVRTDGWLAGLDTGANREDLDRFEPNRSLDIAAGHGSFCAGIVQQIVPEAHIEVCKELDSNGLADELRIAKALVREVRASLEAGQHVIVNLSLGVETVDDERPVALSAALEIVDEGSRQAGLEAVVVAAAGNFGHDRPCYPAAFPTVTAVAALTQGMMPAQWSSRGSWVDVSTVGEGMRSTFVPGVSQSIDHDFEEFPHDAWALWSGTSFTAPQVAGAIGKIAIRDGVTPTEAKRRLLAGATEVPLYGKRVEILPRI